MANTNRSSNVTHTSDSETLVVKPQPASNQGLAVAAPEEATKAVLSEGTRQELERNGHAVSPFTGALLVGTPDNFREVGQDEYTRVARESHGKRNEKKDSNLL